MIICLGWGSLIWNPRSLPISSNWRHDGPELPIEFARQSSDGRITLVIEHSAPELKVLSADLNITDLTSARNALADREGVSAKFMPRSIGYWSANEQSDHAEARAIGIWAEAGGHQGVVWTALKPRFGNAFVTPTAEEVVAYLGTLSGEARKNAEKYIRSAPKVVKTPYRSLIEDRLGWTHAIHQ